MDSIMLIVVYLAEFQSARGTFQYLTLMNNCQIFWSLVFVMPISLNGIFFCCYFSSCCLLLLLLRLVASAKMQSVRRTSHHLILMDNWQRFESLIFGLVLHIWIGPSDAR